MLMRCVGMALSSSEFVIMYSLQTLKASPLSNRRSGRPAEYGIICGKHSEGVPHHSQRATAFRVDLFVSLLSADPADAAVTER